MHYPRSVAVTWETTLNQLNEPARALLRLLAWLAPDPILRALFRGTEADQIFVTAVAGPGGNAPTSEVSLDEALAALAKYSMVQWTDATNASVQLHRLVQEITRGQLAAEARRFWLEQALWLVDAALPPEPPPDDVRSWPTWEPCQPHVASLVVQADRAGIAAAYYAMFQAAQVALEHAGAGRMVWSHHGLQAAFATELIHRRKRYSAFLRNYLVSGLEIRQAADYGYAGVSRRVAQRVVYRASTCVAAVEEELSHGSAT